MKITIEKKQDKTKGGLLSSGHLIFTINIHAELTPEERALIEKYSSLNERVSNFMQGEKAKIISLKGLITDGYYDDSTNYKDLVEIEGRVVSGCQGLLNYCKNASAWGGKQDFDIE